MVSTPEGSLIQVNPAFADIAFKQLHSTPGRAGKAQTGTTGFPHLNPGTVAVLGLGAILLLFVLK